MKYLIASILLFSLISARLDRYFFKLNDSFCPSFIIPKWENCPQLETISNKPLPPCLDEPFTYWTKGKQSFVFKNDKWILKFARLPKYARRGVLHKKPSPHLSTTLLGFKWANDALFEETGVIYAHLKPTNFLNKKIVLIDRFQNLYSISVDETPFVLQKKAAPYFEEFDKLSLTEAKDLIYQTVKLYSKLYKKGFIDHDPIFDKNLGIVDGKPIIIDIGQIEPCSDLPPKQQYLKQMTQSLSGKLERDSPELHSYYKKLLQ